MKPKLEQLSAALDIPVDDLKERLAHVALSRMFDGEPQTEPDWLPDSPAPSALPRLPTSDSLADLPVPDTGLRYEAVTGEPTQRLSIDIPASLHQAVKTGCYQRGRTIREEVVAILQNHYCPEA